MQKKKKLFFNTWEDAWFISPGYAHASRCESTYMRERVFRKRWHVLFLSIYINKNVNVTLFVISYLRNFFTDCFEIWTQLCSRNRE
jgi:hypothetical protein